MLILFNIGTPHFVAPEVFDTNDIESTDIKGTIDFKADIWSLGVILFLLTFGYPPFFEDQEETSNQGLAANADFSSVYKAIRKGFLNEVKEGMGPWFPQEYLIGTELRSLIAGMLEKDLSKRFTAEECLSHKWFTTSVSNKKLPMTVLKAFTKFSAQCRFRLLMARMFAYQIEQSERDQLDRIFNECDTNNDGEVTWEEFRNCMKQYNRAFTDDQLEMMFSMLDIDNNDRISKEEMLTAYSAQRLCAVDERLFEAFSKLDRDGDGYITREEIKQVMKNINPELPNTMHRLASVGQQEFGNILDGMIDEDKEDSDDDGNVISPRDSNYNNRIMKSPNMKQQSSVNSNASDDVNGNKPGHTRDISPITAALFYADENGDEKVDFEEFLRVMHPKYTEPTMSTKQEAKLIREVIQSEVSSTYTKTATVAKKEKSRMEQTYNHGSGINNNNVRQVKQHVQPPMSATFPSATSFTSIDGDQEQPSAILLPSTDAHIVGHGGLDDHNNNNGNGNGSGSGNSLLNGGTGGHSGKRGNNGKERKSIQFKDISGSHGGGGNGYNNNNNNLMSGGHNGNESGLRISITQTKINNHNHSKLNDDRNNTLRSNSGNDIDKIKDNPNNIDFIQHTQPNIVSDLSTVSTSLASSEGNQSLKMGDNNNNNNNIQPSQSQSSNSVIIGHGRINNKGKPDTIKKPTHVKDPKMALSDDNVLNTY